VKFNCNIPQRGWGVKEKITIYGAFISLLPQDMGANNDQIKGWANPIALESKQDWPRAE
jgi:hypothetical protein